MPRMTDARPLRRLVLAAALSALAAPIVVAPLDAEKPLSDRVVIRRDTFGVPHIVGETEAAVGFGFGYAQAEDHAADMARRFLAARGEAAKHLGPAFLENDLAMRRADNLGESRRALARLDRTFREVLEGFAEGYNLYARGHRDALPPFVVEITAADALALTHTDAPSDAASPSLLRALQQKYPDGAPPPADPLLAAGELEAGAEATEQDGSNAIALSGLKTTSGAPMLLGNPHLRWQQLYWEAHVKVPGRLDFYGSTLVGYPWLRAGFNDRLGYVQTNNNSDNRDIFALPLDPARPDHYRFEGKPRPLRRVDVAVDVKQDDGSMTTERRTYWQSHLGPIVYRNAATAFAHRSTAADAWRWFEGFWRLSHARSLRDYMKVMSTRFSPESNYTYADADGNILYLWNSRIPKRVQDGTDYDLDVPGGTKKYVWKELHPTRDLPQMLNPPGGYIQNANNPPWYVTLRQPLDPARYPAYFERGELGLRPQLALDMVEAREKFSVDDLKRLKYDTRLLLAERVKPALLEAIAAQAAPSEELAEARRVLERWDNRASAESRGAVLFERFWNAYRAEVRQPYAESWDAKRPAATPLGIANPEAALRHLAEAVTWARAAHGSADVAWGDVNRYRFGDIDLPGEGASSALGAFRVQVFDAPENKDSRMRVAGWGAADRQLVGGSDAWVLLVHFTRPVQAFSVMAYGQTTDRSSAHSRDQIRIFANRDLRPAWFTDADIAAHTEREYRPR
ncbi:MAG: penicillin acylase family protein [Vicinamibacterales bacterium]